MRTFGEDYKLTRLRTRWYRARVGSGMSCLKHATSIRTYRMSPLRGARSIRCLEADLIQPCNSVLDTSPAPDQTPCDWQEPCASSAVELLRLTHMGILAA
jgi:hypothetical protein